MLRRARTLYIQPESVASAATDRRFIAPSHTFSRRYSGDGLFGEFPTRVRARNLYGYGPQYGGGGGNRTHGWTVR